MSAVGADGAAVDEDVVAVEGVAVVVEGGVGGVGVVEGGVGSDRAVAFGAVLCAGVDCRATPEIVAERFAVILLGGPKGGAGWAEKAMPGWQRRCFVQERVKCCAG